MEPSISQTSSKVTRQQFRFVDLAGSERVHKSGVIGQRRKEATTINKSLSVLGLVIHKLGRGEAHIPYRDSILTMLLKSSLEGRAFTSVIINISSDAQHAKETISSLRFGESMTGMSSVVLSHAANVIGNQELELEATKKKSILNGKISQLADMNCRGLGGTFFSKAVPSEKKTFLENVAKMDAKRNIVTELKIRLAEARSSGRGETITRIERALTRARDSYMVTFGLVAREKQIPSFWIPPAPSYIALEQEILSLTINI